MKVYTRTGDSGQTSLFNGARVAKHDPRVDAYGTVDECNSTVGLACSLLRANVHDPDVDVPGIEELLSRLTALQHRLFDLGAHLATPRDSSSPQKLAKTCFPSIAAEELEAWIDDMETGLQPLTTFILPGGHPASAALHIARTVARRAERAVTPMLVGTGCDGEGETDTTGQQAIDPAAYRFLNRLSDFFFVASRQTNKLMNKADVTWTKQTEATA
jgi:cob(I)alamin adenosyltransferase